MTSKLFKNYKWFLVVGSLAACVAVYLIASQTAWLPAFSRIPAPLPSPAGTRDGRWRQDVAYLASQLPRLHVNSFHATRREEFE